MADIIARRKTTQPRRTIAPCTTFNTRGAAPTKMVNRDCQSVSDDIDEVTVFTANGPIKEMPAAILTDEILMEGEGQVKAFICVGGNPLLVWPGEEKSYKALNNLNLLVGIDYKILTSAEMADCLVGAKFCLEFDDLTVLTDIWDEKPYRHYAKAVVKADAIEEGGVVLEARQTIRA